ncbi:MAG: hypothetical protein R2710_05580 [Acidimicrobiales bacterium]
MPSRPSGLHEADQVDAEAVAAERVAEERQFDRPPSGPTARPRVEDEPEGKTLDSEWSPSTDRRDAIGGESGELEWPPDIRARPDVRADGIGSTHGRRRR